MGGWVVSIILVIIIVYLFLKYKEKQALDVSERNKLDTEVALLIQ